MEKSLQDDDDFEKQLAEHVEADGLIVVDPEEKIVEHPKITEERRN